MDRQELRGRVFDADNHMYEPREALTQFLPDAYRGAFKYVEVDGRTKIAVRGQISDYIPNPTFDRVAAPGAHEDYIRHGNPEGRSHREVMGAAIDCRPAFREPGPRLELMDEQGLDRTLMFPTLASLVEERFRDDPDATHVVVHALNRWLNEVWSFNHQNRIYTTPIITLPIVELAIRELEWVLERGARAILIRPAPVPGFKGPRSFGLPEFDPFWELVQSEKVLVTMHASDSGYSRQVGEWEGFSEYTPFQVAPLRSYWNLAHQPMADAVAALSCHGALTRFPDLKIMSVENGSDWVPALLSQLASVHKKMPQMFPEEPTGVIHRNFYISPFWEDDIQDLGKYLLPDHIVFGSDYPHPEGLADPMSYVDHLVGLSEQE
ncbi:MAG: amidohydrolase, partial [Thermoplasmata archaeon]|nr:amidohydrolase [Thermoplasmata archaeon]